MDDKMSDLHGEFLNALEEQLSDTTLADDETGAVVEHVASKVIDSLSISAKKRLAKHIRSTVGKDRAARRLFQKRNFRRWQPAFDQLEFVLLSCLDIGAHFHQQYKKQASQDDDYLFLALVNLHAKALLVSNEVLSLMMAGFADAALARWRSVHECNVISTFMMQADDPNATAERYYYCDQVQSIRAMKNYQKYTDRSGMTPYSDEEMQSAEKLMDDLISKYGKHLKANTGYGWAAKNLGLNENHRPTLFDLEAKTGLDHWRPRFQWASRHIHGSYRPSGSLLGSSETMQPHFLVGASNAGLVDPAAMVVISIVGVTTALLGSKSDDLENVVLMKLLYTYIDDVQEVFLWCDRRTSELRDSHPHLWDLLWAAEKLKGLISGGHVRYARRFNEAYSAAQV